ncbi:M15 family metallopeptidase [Agilicoccus flavus]|uniref:M15 family metallopeptidase n=1 Tax=Agilicoccus flavus TaxID=2775968 RepID=UPI001CF644B3|nr:M15 family metallopeptidase [Agilicoccus flavus]
MRLQHRWRVGTTIAMVASGLCLTAPAVSAAPAPAPSAGPAADPNAPGSTAGGSGDDKPSLTPAQVKAQVAQATRLQADLEKSNAQVAAASRKLAALAARSNAAMSAVTAAKAAEATARTREATQLRLLRSLSRQAAGARTDVDRMAYEAYVNGSTALRDIAAIVDLASDTTDNEQNAALVQFLADARRADERRYTSLAKAQQVTAKAAVAARLQREAATAKAVAAQKQVDGALAAQQTAVLDLQKVARGQSAALGKLGITSGSGGGVDLAALKDMVTKPLCSSNTGVYPNGHLPGAALCAIEGRPGHMMRPVAARALNALATAYKKDTGQELCITDTYRSYAAQVSVKARKPVLAAKPGTSNHGLGLATDLCGGIESFGTPAHLWMTQHAPLFGFYHPAWAQADGSKPEPWHWEYAQ